MQQVVSPYGNGWRELYLAALFENDREKLAERIAEAEKVYSEWPVGTDPNLHIKKVTELSESCNHCECSCRAERPATRDRLLRRRSAARATRPQGGLIRLGKASWSRCLFTAIKLLQNVESFLAFSLIGNQTFSVEIVLNAG